MSFLSRITQKSVVTLFAIAAMGMTYGQVMAQKNNNRKDFEMGKSIEILTNIFRDATVFYVDTVSSQKMLKDAADGMLMKLDPYTEYLPETEMKSFEMITKGKYGGIGSIIRQSGPWIEISEPYKDSPSDVAGLKAGDRIVEIDGISMRNLGVAGVSAKLKGNPNTKFEITIAPVADTNTLRKVTLSRRNIKIPAVSYSGIISRDVGYIRLETFSESSSDEVRTEMVKLLENKNLKGIVLDLRGNGGGLVDQAVNILSMFLPRGTKVVEVRGKIKEYDSNNKTASAPLSLDIPLAVLINNSSASASEIVAGTIQDLDRGVVIGQRSFGKGLVQVTRPMGYNSYLKITTAKYYIPSGRSIQAMDYTHRSEQGNASAVADSLIKEWRTKGGRKVYDGGGITPDIQLKAEYLSKFSAILYSYGYIDDFANRYVVNHKKRLQDFEISDSIYNEFMKFMDDKPIEFESITEIKLKELKSWAKREKYETRIQDELQMISEKIKDDKSQELRTFANEIKRLLSEAIINRWYYAAGRIEYSLKSDNEVIQAAQLLKDTAKYQYIIKEQDTLKTKAQDEDGVQL